MSPADLANAERVAAMKAARRAELKAEAVKAKAEEESRKAHELMQLNAAVADCLGQLQATWLMPLRDANEEIDRWNDCDTGHKHMAVPFSVPGHRCIRLVMKFIASGSTGYWMPCVTDGCAWRARAANSHSEYFDNLADALICAEVGDAENDTPIPF